MVYGYKFYTCVFCDVGGVCNWRREVASGCCSCSIKILSKSTKRDSINNRFTTVANLAKTNFTFCLFCSIVVGLLIASNWKDIKFPFFFFLRLQDHIQEVLDKWHQIDDEIWAKLIVMERNRRVAKAYARAIPIQINGSDDGFDGFRYV